MAQDYLNVAGVAVPLGGADPFDPLGIGWTAAYWAEDPGWTNPGNGNPVPQWDDAVASANLTNGSAPGQPIYRSSVAALGSKPALQFDGSNDALGTAAGAWTALSMPGEIVIVGALTSTSVAYGYFVDGNNGGGGPRWAFGKSGAAADWHMYAGTIVDAGAPDLLGHLFDLQYAGGANSKAVIDGVQVISGDVGSRQCDSLTVGAAVGNGSSQLPCYIAFIGVHNGALSAGERSNLLAWAQGHYATP